MKVWFGAVTVQECEINVFTQDVRMPDASTVESSGGGATEADAGSGGVDMWWLLFVYIFVYHVLWLIGIPGSLLFSYPRQPSPNPTYIFKSPGK